MADVSGERGQHGISRILSKLTNSLESGNYYEAHQMYRTLYFRYTAQQKFDECLNLLFKGTNELFEKKQETSAADLALLLIDTLQKRGNSTDTDIWINHIGSFIARLSPTTVERETLINRAVKWSGGVLNNNLGHPAMHKRIAQMLFAEGNFEQGRQHFLLCRDAVLCARILIQIQSRKGYTNEIDLFIAQAVLQMLCLKDLQTAESTFMKYATNHPKIGKQGPEFKQPLLNFIHFLFRSIEMKRLDYFQALCNAYKPALSRDPCFEKYLLKIGVLYLDAQPAVSNSNGLMGGMFGDLFSRLFQGFDDEEEQREENQIDNIVTNTNELD